MGQVTRLALTAGGLVAAQAVALVTITKGMQPTIGDWHRGDVQLYRRAGQRVLQGALPYRDFQLEYPPGSLLSFVTPHLVAGRLLALQDYADAFMVQSAVLSTVIAIALGVIAWRWWPGRSVAQVLATYAAGVIAGAPLLAFRYDLLPAATTLLALVGVLAGRPLVAGLFLGLGIAIKIYPAVLLAVVGLFYLAQRRFRAAAAVSVGVVVPLVLIAVPFASPKAGEWLAGIAFFGARGIQVESVPGGVLLAVNAFGLARVGVSHIFGAHQLSAPIADAVARWQPLVLALALASILALSWRRFRAEARESGTIAPATLVTAMAAALLAFMVANKVFSAQYLIWLLPFAPLLPWRQGLLFVGAWALTNVVYPWYYEILINSGRSAITILNLRNAVALALLAWLVLDLWQPRRAPSPVPRAAAEPAQ
ncbi:MAG: DUF2029 domain-containing protein [Chloroflexi bacterium]|nr:DUF2029 domain-containing protein [Chloroflexota bacterium]